MIIVCLSWTQDSNLSKVTQYHRKIERKLLQARYTNSNTIVILSSKYCKKQMGPKQIEPQQMEVFTCGQKLDSAL